MMVDRNGLEVLSRDECLHLLSTSFVGRVAVTIGALPVILPVSFRLVADRVVFRTAVGTKLDAATCNAVVAFEVDQIDRAGATGWSVMVTGIARAAGALDPSDAPRWAPAGDGRLVEISTDMVSGRRLMEAGRDGQSLLGNTGLPSRR